jgi:ubiquinone/menaquinone biosynthesis C-methylase UbiE
MEHVSADDFNQIVGFGCLRSDHQVTIRNGVYWLTENPNLAFDSDSPDYIGYDTIADHYDRGRDSVPGRVRSLVAEETLRRCRRSSASLLDVGAGTGAWSIPFSKSGASVVAADISSNMLRILLHKAKQADVRVVACRVNATALPFRDQSFDLVTMESVLHLVSRPERVVREIKRVLRPDGILATLYQDASEGTHDEAGDANRRFDAVWTEAYRRHHEIAMAKGQKHTPRPGWWSDTQHDNLRQHFARFEEVRIPGATYDSVCTLRENFEDLRNLAYSDKVRFDRVVNEEVMVELEAEIGAKHGSGVWDLHRRQRVSYAVTLYHV